jgi:hypothetical protein
MYCIIKCIKNKCILKGKFASSVFHSCNAKTHKTQICVTGPQCVNYFILCSQSYKITRCMSGHRWRVGVNAIFLFHPCQYGMNWITKFGVVIVVALLVWMLHIVGYSHIVLKSTCFHHHVCLSVYIFQYGPIWMDFHEIWYWGTYMKICWAI